MAIKINSGTNNSIYSSSTTTTTIGSVNTSIGYSWMDQNEKVKDFIEFGLQIMGIDLTYDKFIEMDEMERKTFIRDYRLEKLLKNNE